LHQKNPNYQQLRSKYLKSLLDIREESTLLKDVKDILDEVKMINAVLLDQRKVFLDDMLSDNMREFRDEFENFEKLTELIGQTYYNLENMKEHAQAVEVGVSITFVDESSH
jgi:hypothetical protein